MPANKANKPLKSKKVFDVARPGKTPAEPSGKPVIIRHNMAMADPMVRSAGEQNLADDKAVILNKAPEEDRPSGSPPLSPSEIDAESSQADTTEEPNNPPTEPDKAIGSTSPTKLKISIDDDTGEISSANKSAKPEPAEPAEPSALAEPVEADEAKAEPKTNTEERSKSSETEADQVASSVSTEPTLQNQAQADKETQRLKEEKDRVQKLASSGQYFVPIGEKTRKRRSTRHVLIGIIFILLLGIVLADLLIDIGLIKTSIQPPVRIFSHK